MIQRSTPRRITGWGARRPAAQADDDSGDDATNGLGRDVRPEALPRLWRELEDFLEPLGRALGRALGRSTPANGLSLAACRGIWSRGDGTPARASDMLPVATCSTRKCSTRRFFITRSSDGG